jgi:cholesterol oxidase
MTAAGGHDCDYAVIGSGFGGSVAALRLAQKGYRVQVLEAGRSWNADDFPASNWDTRRYIWAPPLLHGLQRMKQMRHLLVVAGTGVGGGSLIYGNTLFSPGESFFSAPIVRRLGGAQALLPYFELAQKMMGVVPNPRLTQTDEVLRRTAATYGREDSFTPSPVGVFFGPEGQTVEDPYFLGQGPGRTGCDGCGRCFIGCPSRAKNSLDLNYLYLAQRLGARVVPQTLVRRLRPLSEDGADGYELETRSYAAPRGRRRGRLRARAVVVAGGVLGSVQLLLEARLRGDLPRLSSRVGWEVRSNSESILGVMARDRSVDRSRGLAASSSVFPDEHTQVQADRYPAGSDVLSLLSTLLVDGGGRLPRWLRLLGTIIRHPLDFLRTLLPWGFSRRSAVLVVMQDLESSLRFVLRRRWWWPFSRTLASRLGGGKRVPAYIPAGNTFARRMAKQMDGIPLSSLSEVLLNAPVTAHILGGAVMAETPEAGVVDLDQRVFGYKNLLVCDGSVIPANLGVNPALSILAFAERAMAAVPIKDELRALRVDEAWQVRDLLCR